MADQSKAERLAAARKKLQDFQRKKESHLAPSSIIPTLASDHQNFPSEQSLVSSGKLPNNGTFNENTSQSPSISPHVPLGTSDYELPQDSGGNTFGASQSSLNGFEAAFGSADKETHLQDCFHPGTSVPYTMPETQSVFSASSYFNNNVNSAHKSVNASVANSHALSQENSPEQDTTGSSTAHLFANSGEWDFNPPPFAGSQDISNSSTFHGLTTGISHQQIPEKESSLVTKMETSQSVTSPVNVIPGDTTVQDVYDFKPVEVPETDRMLGMKDSENSMNGRSSAESIRQLSDQITQLIDPSVEIAVRNGSCFTSSLETQNQELVAQLASERLENQKLHFALKESQSQVSHLELKVQELQSQQELVLAQNLGPLQEQLRAHARTVGILVGEKTELEAALAHHSATAKQHASEVEELQNRLRVSRHRVSELEKELASAATAASAADKEKNNNEQEVDQLRLQNGMLSKQLEDAEQEASELRQKMSARVSEVGTLTAQLQEKQSQLSLAQLRLTQLSASDNPEASAEIESLHQLKISLERRCTELTETVRQVTADRDQADQQYQQYVAQLNGQLQAANAKFESLSIENNKLRSREEELVHTMSELERQLQHQIQLNQQHIVQHNKLQQQTQQQNEVSPDRQSSLQEQIAELEMEKQALQSSYDTKVQELSSLQVEVEEKEIRIAELEALCSDRPDQSRLLAAMESDKVAAAQATSQNTVLKQQLQELQDGFIKMSNDKLNLTESLEHEKHVNKEMGEKISQLAEELHELRVLVTEKERRLQEYRQREYDHDESHDHSSCNDHHDHNHEAEHKHDHSHYVKDHEHTLSQQSSHDASSLQEQLNQAQERIHNLNSQNNSLHRLIAQKSTESHESGSSSSATEGATTDDAAADHETNCDENSSSHANYRCLQYAMNKLQERFTQTMSEVAELSDEKQRLEHLVLQLQGETETIGEYVTLYQMQRAALQQRAREKDHQLAALSAEREELRRKLHELNQLVHRLLEERGPETAKEALTSLGEGSENLININEPSDVIEIPNVAEVISQENNTNQDVAKQLSKKILSIIEDINVSNDVETSFHPCPWCSGRLKNV